MIRGLLGVLCVAIVSACSANVAPTHEHDMTPGKPNPDAPTQAAPAASSGDPSVVGIAEPVDPDDPPVDPPTLPPTASGRCDAKKPFGAPTLATGINASTNTSLARLSSDELSVFFTRTATKDVIFLATRPDGTSAWTEAKPITEVGSTTGNDGGPTVTADGLTMFLHSTRAPTVGDYDIWVSRRPTRDAVWGAPTTVRALNTANRDKNPFVRADGRMIVFNSNRATTPATPALGQELYRAYIDETGGASTPTRIVELGSPADESYPILSPDGLALYFARKGGSDDVFVARRASLNERFGTPQHIDEIATPADEHPTWISPDDCVLWFSATTATSTELYVAQRPL